MPFQKGNKLAPAKGTIYRHSLKQKFLTAQLEKFVKKNVIDIQKNFDNLETSKDKLYFLESVFDYCIPKQRAMDLTSNGESVQPALQVIVAGTEQQTKIDAAIKEISQ